MAPISVENYLRGVQAGCALAGLRVSPATYKRAATGRGWSVNHGSALDGLEALGLDEATIIVELVGIQQDAFRLAAAR